MLEVWPCKNASERREYFLKASSERDSWIVPDLQSKWHLQSRWLEARGVLEQSAVLRATELWRQIAFQVCPDVRYISQELAQTLIWNWLECMLICTKAPIEISRFYIP